MAALLFDLDGTIADSAPGILSCLRATLEEFGAAPSAEADLTWVIGPPLHAVAERLLGGPERVDACVAAYRRRYAEQGILAAEPFPGVVDELRRLKAAGHALFVCTSKITPFAEQIVGRFGLAELFDGVYGAAPQAAADDKVRLAGRIVSERRLDAAETCLIGDRREDVKAGRANGLRSIGVLWGYGSRDELAEAGADRLCAAPVELSATLSALLA
ncbi:HAD hydrolase-like protein [Phenylobacterium sp.]|uniref:HAD hydrolase-like protein n=1 Tax=Phenylobacterium sp. TaxID=1871053 RepID=UPI002E33C385|nr:HAD hydrolase-like protein [Phenylobacterium sp.]HEX2562068.1 HAD hydrolase-like protein [Phenylobacterium sp.]